MDQRHVTDQQDVLAAMAREGLENRTESALAASSDLATAVWPVRVKSRVDYNVYKVRRVIIEDAGVTPTEFGAELEATNLAESFISQGTLTAGAYVIAFCLGEKNVFHTVP